jgi:hypothetical protein
MVKVQQREEVPKMNLVVKRKVVHLRLRVMFLQKVVDRVIRKTLKVVEKE